MKISKLVLGMISTNCYIVVDNDEAMIVDPAAGADKILAELKKFKDVKVKYIALTHAHWDHLLATPELVAKTGAKVLCHEEDLDKLFSKKIADESPRAVQKAYAEGRAMGIEPQVLHEGDTFTVGTKTFEVIHTPGHTRGSVCFYCKEEKVLFGPGYIEDELCGCRFRISSSSFYQTNPIAAEALYELAVEMADLRSSDRIGDAYCGTGTIGIVAAKASGAELIGIERNAEAVKDAEINAQINGIENATFVAADAGSEFARMARRGEELDVVFMDPPRAGSSQAFLANLSRLGPRRVVYISCDPKTQIRDIKHLVHNGYRIKRICPVDMFPHTDHVENVVLLERAPRNQFGHRRNSHKDERGGKR